ncbi:MAG: YCF48-related protein [FCB group bacterium]|jgi:photosystem II stability/assembly factor-like uncharacterized protein
MWTNTCFCLVFIFLTGITSYAQDWIKANGNKELPDSTGITALATYGNYVFAGTSKGVYFSPNNGTDWTWRNTGMYDTTVNSRTKKLTLYGCYFLNTTTGFAVGENGIILNLTQSGSKWKAINSTTAQTLRDIEFINGKVGFIVGDSGTVLLTLDSGQTWAAQTITPLNGSNPASENLYTIKFGGSNTGYLGGTNGFIAKITVNMTGGNYSGNAIQQVASGVMGNIYGFYFNGIHQAYAVGNGGLIIKLNASDGWDTQLSNVSVDLHSVYFSDPNTGYIAGDGSLLLKTTDAGSSWVPQYLDYSFSMQFNKIFFTAASTGYLVGNEGKMYKTTNAGVDWTVVNSGTTFDIYGLYFKASSSGFIVGDSTLVSITTNAGTNWVNKKIDTNVTITHTTYGLRSTNAFVLSGSTLIAGTNSGISVSVDTCNNWCTNKIALKKDIIYSFLLKDNIIFAGTSSGIYKSTDNGGNWTAACNGFKKDMDSSVFALAVKGNDIFAATGGGVFSSSDNGANWMQRYTVPSGDPVFSVVTTKNTIIISIDGWGEGVYISSDNGNNWVPSNSGLKPETDTRFFLLTHGDSVFAAGAGTGGMGTGVYISTDFGYTWKDCNAGLSAYVQANQLMMATNGNYIFIGSTGSSGFCNLYKKVIHSVIIKGVEEDFTGTINNVNVYPNPANNKIYISYNLTTNRNVSISINDVLGNEVYLYSTGQRYAGQNNENIDLSALPQGVYYLKLSTGANAMTRIIEVVR